MDLGAHCTGIAPIDYDMDHKREHVVIEAIKRTLRLGKVNDVEKFVKSWVRITLREGCNKPFRGLEAVEGFMCKPVTSPEENHDPQAEPLFVLLKEARYYGPSSRKMHGSSEYSTHVDNIQKLEMI